MKKLTQKEAVKKWFTANHPVTDECECCGVTDLTLTANGLCLRCMIESLVDNFHNTDIEYCDDCGEIIPDPENEGNHIDGARDDDDDGVWICDKCL